MEFLRKERGCKLGIIFYDMASVDLDLYSGDKKERILKLVETVMRMILKGCLHYLYNENWKIELERIVTDGEPWHRKLDKFRIIQNLLPEIREYVDVLPNCEIVSCFSDHKDPKCDDANSAQILQLTDILLGSVIQSFFRDLKNGAKKEIIVRPVREMLDKRKRGSKFQHSSHYRSFTISLAKVNAGVWYFKQLNTKEVIIEDGQLILLDVNN